MSLSLYRNEFVQGVFLVAYAIAYAIIKTPFS